jgi:DNA-binding response OmpR family regulator
LSLSLQDQANRARLQGKRILVVEDEPLIAMEIEATLRDYECKVIGPAGDLEHAMELISRGEHPCDAAVVDTNLGSKRVDKLAAALAQAGIPFAFITGYGVEALPPPFRDALIVSTPFSRNGLLSAMATLLQRRSNPAILQLGRATRPKP